ncbi:MAG: hypothetical protein CMG00_01030 [Candidatus Marinimicrobia bacterium]|nr:hypothetical protein [Candidatus Neomarinimicrobiota bacterium]|tara:strand:- start:17446 stop:18069 length:624 start_codon:yes stop_codon:yes gene_type:complete
MIKSKSLVNGIGSVYDTKNFYDNWSNEYEKTLKNWNYNVPKKSILILENKLKKIPNNILDLACGTGLFGKELNKIYNKSKIYGSDISKKSLILAKNKNIYKKLILSNFETRYSYNIKFELVSIIGAMTYCKNFDKLFSNVRHYLNIKGHFIFSHRIDLWEYQEFDKILEKYSRDFKINFKSRPINYLPLNKDFKSKIKIRLVLLQKY